TFRALTNLSWTDTAVDTKGTLASTATGIMPSGICTGTAAQCSGTPGAGVAGVAGNPFRGGKERYLGNEWILGLTYRFAPNMAFNLVGAALITGDALNHQRTGPVGSGIEPCATNGVPTCQSRNVYKLSARFRLTF